jgi:hypothetical protein
VASASVGVHPDVMSQHGSDRHGGDRGEGNHATPATMRATRTRLELVPGACHFWKGASDVAAIIARSVAFLRV